MSLVMRSRQAISAVGVGRQVPAECEPAAPPTSVSIIIPMFNEALRIASTIRVLSDWRPTFGASEIVFVDDGSTDETIDALQAALRQYPLVAVQSVRLLRLDSNCGKGAAVRAGVAEAHGAIVGFLDADLSASPEEFERAVGILLASNVDVVAGSRAMDNSELTRREGFYRRCASRVLHRIVVATGMSGLSDTQCGLKVFRSENASVMFAEQVCTRFAFDIEMLLRAERCDLKIVEMPVRWGRVDGSHVVPLRDGARMLIDLLRIRRAVTPHRRVLARPTVRTSAAGADHHTPRVTTIFATPALPAFSIEGNES